MVEFISNAKYYLILFIFPLMGLLFNFKLERKTRLYLLIVSAIIIIPAFFGYRYVVYFIYHISGLLFLSSGFSLMIDEITSKKKKLVVSIILTVLLLFVLGYFTFLSAFAGNRTVKKEWEIDNYKIEYIKDQGFAGGPLMKYELNKYTLVPILIKRLETSTNIDSTNNCLINFEMNYMLFDKCNSTLNKKMMR